MKRPVNLRKLLDYTEKLLNTRTSGTVKGIPVHSFLQILEAFRLRSERDKLQKKDTPTELHQLPLKHLSTRENRRPLEKMASSEHRVIIKYIQKGRLWMFKSQLLKAIDSPSRLLFLEYPAVIHYHELRETKKTSIFVPCTFHQQNEPELYETLTDLSTGGRLCRIKNRSNTNLPNIEVNSRIQLRCLLPGTKKEQKINCIVRNLKKDSSATGIGVEFENLQPHLIETISKYLYTVKE